MCTGFECLNQAVPHRIHHGSGNDAFDTDFTSPSAHYFSFSRRLEGK